MLQVVGWASPSLPEPWQESQATEVGTRMVAFLPW